MNTRLCTIDGCVDIGHHHTDCGNPNCRGCMPRATERGLVCNSDRTRIAAEVVEVQQLLAELAADSDPVDRTEWTVHLHLLPVPTTNPARMPAWIPGPWRTERGSEPLAQLLPMGIVRTGQRGARVSGSREAPVPVNLDRIDLTDRARPRSRELFARGVLGLDPDQIGHLSLATELQDWIGKWITWRGKDEHQPRSDVHQQIAWLAARLDDAFNDYPEIDDFARDIGEYRATMRSILGLHKAPREMLYGVPCRTCDRVTLYREDGHIHCGNCRLYYSEKDYTEWTKLLAGQARRMAV